jgi:hypothetical protein
VFEREAADCVDDFPGAFAGRCCDAFAGDLDELFGVGNPMPRCGEYFEGAPLDEAVACASSVAVTGTCVMAAR